MISRNLKVTKNNSGYWIKVSALDEAEMSELCAKYAGEVHVKISHPLRDKTMQQLAAFHPLATAFYLTGMHSAPDQFRQSVSLFRHWLKMEFGPTTWVEYQGSHIPICKSIADYTIKDMSQLIEGLICLINESGAYGASADIRNIIEGMQSDNPTGGKHG